MATVSDLRIAALLVPSLLAALLTAGCTTRYRNVTDLGSETRVHLRGPDFETVATHAVGEARCHCVLWLVVSGPAEVRSEAWKRMRAHASLEGKAAQFINVTEEMSTQWAFYPFYWQEVCTVSADAVGFTKGAPVPTR